MPPDLLGSWLLNSGVSSYDVVKGVLIGRNINLSGRRECLLLTKNEFFVDETAVYI